MVSPVFGFGNCGRPLNLAVFRGLVGCGGLLGVMLLCGLCRLLLRDRMGGFDLLFCGLLVVLSLVLVVCLLVGGFVFCCVGFGGFAVC